MKGLLTNPTFWIGAAVVGIIVWLAMKEKQVPAAAAATVQNTASGTPASTLVATQTPSVLTVAPAV